MEGVKQSVNLNLFTRAKRKDKFIIKPHLHTGSCKYIIIRSPSTLIWKSWSKFIINNTLRDNIF